MTPIEQLAAWAASPNDEVFVWLDYPQNDAMFVQLGSAGSANSVGRMRAGDVLATLQRTASPTNRVARNLAARFRRESSVRREMRLAEVNGIACVIVEGASPVDPHASYRLLLSSVEAFT